MAVESNGTGPPSRVGRPPRLGASLPSPRQAQTRLSHPNKSFSPCVDVFTFFKGVKELLKDII